MTTVRMLPRSKRFWRRAVGGMLGTCAVWLASAALSPAQEPAVHWQHSSALPPGAIGGRRLGSGGPLSGYFQPVDVKAPAGSTVQFADVGGFGDQQSAGALVGMFVAPVYRLKLTHIPGHEGQEVFPTIEIIDRLYPPSGEETRFPIPVTITQDDLELVLTGRYVTRIVYLEDPATATPVAQPVGEESWFEVEPGSDLLAVADALGRPVAILRMGGRTPGPEGPDAAFLYGSPPVKLFDRPPPREAGPLSVPSQSTPSSDQTPSQTIAALSKHAVALGPANRSKASGDSESRSRAPIQKAPAPLVQPTALVNPAALTARSSANSN